MMTLTVSAPSHMVVLVVGIGLALLLCLPTGTRAVAREQGVSRKPAPDTCNSTSWGNVNIRVPSVPEPMGGIAGSICNSSVPFVIVEEVVWRCERRYCCEDSCQCGDNALTEELCMPQPPRLVPTELICLVQHKRAPRFFRYVCCGGFEEVDTQCVAIIDCDAADRGGCAHDCVPRDGTHVCSCRPGYQLNGRTQCTEVPSTTTTTTPPPTTTPKATTRLTSIIFTVSKIPKSKSGVSATAQVTSTPAVSTMFVVVVSSLPLAADHISTPLWVLILLLLLGAIVVFFVICCCLLCRKRKPLNVAHEDAHTTGYENATYGRASGMVAIRPGHVTSKKGYPPITVQGAEGGGNQKSIKVVENDLYDECSSKGASSKAPRVFCVMPTEKCGALDEDESYLMPNISAYASGLPPPYKEQDPYEVILEGAVGGTALPMKHPLQDNKMAQTENSLNENMENIYSEIH